MRRHEINRAVNYQSQQFIINKQMAENKRISTTVPVFLICAGL